MEWYNVKKIFMYMSGLVLKYDGRKITIQEPTIQMWTEVMKFRELLDEEELNIRMLSLTTGLSVQEIKESDAHSMRIAADTVYKFLNQESKKLFKDIEHNGKKYVLVDVHKMSFGQFVDIDTFLQKDENYRVSNLNELAAYLYTEEGKKYGETDFRKQIEDFKTLPVKYVEGAIFFLLSIGVVSQQLSVLYSKNKPLWMWMMIRVRLQNIGDGIQQYLHLPTTKFGWLTMLLIFPLYLVSITSHILWTSINRLKSKLKK
jgi:hypothetical protein